jgi:hypothetical protein
VTALSVIPRVRCWSAQQDLIRLHRLLQIVLNCRSVELMGSNSCRAVGDCGLAVRAYPIPVICR